MTYEHDCGEDAVEPVEELRTASGTHTAPGAAPAAEGCEVLPSVDEERAAKIAWCNDEWARGQAIEATLGARYFDDERQLEPPWPDRLRFLRNYRITPDARPRPFVLAAVTDSSGAIVALHSIELDPDTGRKSTRTDQPKRSRGAIGEGTARLSVDPGSPVLVVGEGVETVLTRVLVGPCEAHACLGPLRYVAPAPHHRRVELLADRGAEEQARKLAKRYAREGKVQARVVTVLASLGAKADLNDLLRRQGRRAVEDAELYDARAGGRRGVEYDLTIGSDVEIALPTLDKLEERYGAIVIVEGSGRRRRRPRGSCTRCSRR